MALTLIEEVEITSLGTTDVYFANIPQDGEHLMLSISAATVDQYNRGLWMYFNTSTNSSPITFTKNGFRAQGTGGYASYLNTGQSNIQFDNSLPGTTDGTNTVGVNKVVIHNYAKTMQHGVTENAVLPSLENVTFNQAFSYSQMFFSENSTDPITSLYLSQLNGYDFIVGSRIALYKISQAQLEYSKTMSKTTKIVVDLSKLKGKTDFSRVS